MKKTYFTITLLAFAVLFTGCDQEFLDLTPQDQLNSGDVWKDPNLIELVINEMYQQLPDGFDRGWYMLSSATDDSENAYGWVSGQAFNRGDYSGSSYPMGGTWDNDYQMIRQANLLFDNINFIKMINCKIFSVSAQIVY